MFNSYWSKKDYFISESHSQDVLHLSHLNKPHETLCGKKSMRKGIDLENWNLMQNESYEYCKKCDELKNGARKSYVSWRGF